ncbi:MAG: DUF4070 domain-containing protein [Spirochaetes bacterium]|nr:DUF4070 domain-containing protein [Spirochaetota bacterium]
MKILMIYPEIPMTYWGFKYILKMVGRKSAFPPLGLMTVAALLPAEYDVTIVDMNAQILRERDIERADLVFISAMIIQKDSFDEVVKLCTKLGRTVVAGGPYPTGSHAGITGVDHFVLGEAEATLPRFLRDYENGVPERMYTSAERPDIRQTPVPRFDLIKHSRYTTMSIQYSRGCPFNCEFCDIIELFGRVPRTKDPEQFLAEMDALYSTGYRGPLFIVDDNFIGNKKNVKKLLPAIARWQRERKYPYMILTEASINMADDEELMDMMVDAGFNKVFIGIETPVEESLALSHKTQNMKVSMLESVERIQRKGMEVTAGFILGFDSDPEDVFDRQIEFIRRSGIPVAMVGLLTALPNTQLYRRLESENRIIMEASGNNTHDLLMNFTPAMDMDKLVRGYRRVLSTIYSPHEYFNRCLTLMERMPKGRVGRGAFSFWTILLVVRIFLSSVIRQTLSNYGSHYIGFLRRAVKLKPGMLPKAVKTALFGHHFFRMTREIVAVDEFTAALEKIRRSLRARIERVSFDRLEDIVKDVISLDHGVLEKTLVSSLQKKYRKLHENFRSNVEEPVTNLVEEFRVYVDKVAQNIKNIEEKFSGGGKSIDELKEYCLALKAGARKKYRYINREFFRGYMNGMLELFDSHIDRIIRELDSRRGLAE